MELIRDINKRLEDLFGYFETTHLAKFRVVKADEQFEKRHAIFRDYTEGGIFIREVEETREMPKYFNIPKGCWILESGFPVPHYQQDEIGGVKVSYECLWVFKDKNDNPLPIHWPAIEFIVNTVLAQMGLKGSKVYAKPEDGNERNQKRLDEIMEYLYGDISKVEDAFLTKRAVTDFNQKVNFVEGPKEIQ